MARTVVEWVGGRLSTSTGVQVFGCPPRQFAQTPGSSLPRTCVPPGTQHHQRQRSAGVQAPTPPTRSERRQFVTCVGVDVWLVARLCVHVFFPGRVLLCMWFRSLSRSVPASLPCVRVCRWAGCHSARASRRQGVKAPRLDRGGPPPAMLIYIKRLPGGHRTPLIVQARFGQELLESTVRIGVEIAPCTP